MLMALAGTSCISRVRPAEEETEELNVVFSLNLLDSEAEMTDKLGTAHDRPLRAALEDYLSTVLEDSVHDMDLLFYDQRHRRGETVRLTERISGGRQTLYADVPASDYRVAGAANLSAVSSLSLQDEDSEYTLKLVQNASGSVASHRAAVYTARKRVLVRESEEVQTFELPFSMINAVAVLALNRDSCDVRSIRADYIGLADGYKIVDSAFLFDRNAVVKADIIDVSPFMGSDQDYSEEAERFLYEVFWNRWTRTPLMACAVALPSPSVGSEIIGTYAKIWTINLYVDLENGTTTRNQIFIGKPLNPGHLLVIKGWLTENGSFTSTPEHEPYVPGAIEPPSDSTVVGVSVVLNWNQGGSYETVL